MSPRPSGTGHPDPAATRRILVVDDHPVVLDGIRTILAEHPDLRVVGEAGDVEAAVRMAATLQPDAVILDLRMGGRFVPEAPRAVKQAASAARILVHTASEENEPVHAALRAGADGAVFKDGRDLVLALRTLLDGDGGYLDPRLRGERGGTRGTARGGEHGPITEPLSPREYDVLSALALGQSTKEISRDLFLAESTVRSYTKSLLAKLGVRSRIEALAVARRAQLI